jgi:Amt family ammonium transporter
VLGALLFPFFSTSGFSVGVLVNQFIGVAVIALWTFAATAVVFSILKAIGQARVTPEHERAGLDSSEHGVDTYPEFGKPDVAADGGSFETTADVRPDGGSEE